MHSGSGRTGRTETSQYPEDKKSDEIPSVAASERGEAQTDRTVKPAGVGPAELLGHWRVDPAGSTGQAVDVVEWHWKGQPKRVTVP